MFKRTLADLRKEVNSTDYLEVPESRVWREDLPDMKRRVRQPMRKLGYINSNDEWNMKGDGEKAYCFMAPDEIEFEESDTWLEPLYSMRERINAPIEGMFKS